MNGGTDRPRHASGRVCARQVKESTPEKVPQIKAVFQLKQNPNGFVSETEKKKLPGDEMFSFGL